VEKKRLFHIKGGNFMSDSKYILENGKAAMFDFFALINALNTTPNYKDICPRQDITPDPKISDAYYRLYMLNAKISSGLNMFFAYREERKMNFFEWMFRTNVDAYSSCDDLIKEIDLWEPQKLIYQAMRFNDAYNNFQDKFYEEIVNSRDLFMSYMNGLNASTEIRWEIMSFIQHPEDTVKALKDYITRMYREFAIEYSDFSQKIEALNAKLAECIADDSVDAAVIDYEIDEKAIESKVEILSQNITPPTKEIKIVGSIFAPNKIVKINASRDLYYTIGIGYMDYYNSFMSRGCEESQLQEIFKAFTDGTRAQIIEILREKECYNGELSKMLDVPMSSLTHHMEILNNCGFVIKRNVGKRTYYKLNKKQFIDASRLLRRYVEGYDL
jgi:ArsR family transcriptional regulator